MTVVQLKQATTYCGLSPRVEDEIERAYWAMLAAKDPTQTDMPKSDRDAFKAAVRQMFHRIRASRAGAEMSEVRIPTMNLRFVVRKVTVPRPEFGGGVEERTIRVLQQQFDTITNGLRWIDVPCIDDPQEG